MQDEFCDVGRLEILCKKLREENKLLNDNLTSVHTRCTDLLEECRAYKRNTPLDGYQVAAAATSSHKGFCMTKEGLDAQAAERVKMACLGLAGETGETLDLLKKFFYHGHDLDLVKVKKEIGDVLWYVSELCSAFGLSLQDVADANIAKLQARYGSQFSEEKSRNRVPDEATGSVRGSPPPETPSQVAAKLLEEHFGNDEHESEL